MPEEIFITTTQQSPDSTFGSTSVEQFDIALHPVEKHQERERWQFVALTRLYSQLDVILGIVLLLAAILKGHQLLTNSFQKSDLGLPRWLLICVAGFELAFGCWLVGGRFRKLTRWFALAFFTSLSAVAFAHATSGAAACACFGAFHIPSMAYVHIRSGSGSGFVGVVAKGR